MWSLDLKNCDLTQRYQLCLRWQMYLFFFFRLFLSFFVLLSPSCCLCWSTSWRRLMCHWAHRSESKTCKQTSTYVVPLIFLLFPHPWSGVQHPILCKNPFCVWSYEELGDRIYNLSGLLAFCIWLSCFYLLKKLWLKCNHSMGSILWFVSRSQCWRAMFWWRVCEKLLPLLEMTIKLRNAGLMYM